MEKVINVSSADITTFSVTLKTITVSNKKMTQSVFKQIPIRPPYKENGLLDDAQPWGIVHYECKLKNGNLCKIWVVFVKNNTLYKGPILFDQYLNYDSFDKIEKNIRDLMDIINESQEKILDYKNKIKESEEKIKKLEKYNYLYEADREKEWLERWHDYLAQNINEITECNHLIKELKGPIRDTLGRFIQSKATLEKLDQLYIAV